MGNSIPQTKNSTHDNDRLKTNGTLIPPLFGTGCDIWSSPPTRHSIILSPYWNRPNDFICKNSILNEKGGFLSSIISNVLMNPLAVCAPGISLLSKEHLRAGVWHSASTPDLDGKLTTRWSANSHHGNDSEDTSIGLRVTKLFPRLNQNQKDLDALAGIDLQVNVPTGNPSESSPSGSVHAFYHLNLNRSLGGMVLSTTIENFKNCTDMARSASYLGMGIHYNNALKYAKSKTLLLNLGITSQFNLKSGVQIEDVLSSSDGSAYALCNSLSDGLLAGVQVNAPTGKEKLFHRVHLEPVSAAEPLRLSYLLSFDLNRINNIFSSASSPTSPLDSPIVLSFHNVHTSENDSMQKSPYTQVPAITVSQYIPTDRIIFNPLEDRGPQIRNTISWAIQIRQQLLDRSRDLSSPHNTTERPKENVLRAAAAWQMNRNLCTKLHFDTRDGLTLGIILKRWAHPRLTTSILFNRPNGAKSTRFGFKGLCLQVETGPLTHDDKNIYDASEHLYRVDGGQFKTAGRCSHNMKHPAPTMIEYPRAL